MPNPLTLQAYKDWQSAGALLSDSLNRYKPYDHRKKYNPQELEFYDSLSFRYTKALETAFYFFRSLEAELPGNAAQYLRDQLLKIEKLGIIINTDEWINARKLRNIITHSYDPDELEKIFADLVIYSGRIIESLRNAEQHLKTS